MDSKNKLTEIKKRLYAQNPKRINHIEGVAECAMELTDRHFPAIPDVKILQFRIYIELYKGIPQAEHLKILENTVFPCRAMTDMPPSCYIQIGLCLKFEFASEGGRLRRNSVPYHRQGDMSH